MKDRKPFSNKRLPKHGEILSFYACIYDGHIKKELLIPISRLDIIRNRIAIP